MRILSSLFLIATAAAAFLSANGASAQPPCPDLPPIGDTVTCTFVNGQKVLTAGTATTSGFGTFVVTGYSFNPCQAILQPVRFSSQGGSPTLGSVNTSLAPESPATTITGGSATLFPGNLRINLNLNATISTIGTLRSAQPLQLDAGTITSIRPKNVSVHQLAPVNFIDENNKVRATLINTNVTLNGNGN